MFDIHPDDVPSPRFGGWADDFNTYDEACAYYGIETPAQLAAEAAYYDQEAWIASQDDMEARGGPVYRVKDMLDVVYDDIRAAYVVPVDIDDEIPF